MDFFQLVMFDFDGLLVDTERGHYEAYRRMCAQRGVQLGWDFPLYCKYAHYTHDGIKEAMYHDYPRLLASEPDWKVLHREKSRELISLFHEGAIQLMPGVTKLLTELEEQKIQSCVVTHSAENLVMTLRKQHPILDTITHWITREDYSRPKPDPECYQVAMQRFLPNGGKAVGFEDTIRGLQALLGSGALAYLVTTMDYPEIPEMVKRGAKHIRSLEDI